MLGLPVVETGVTLPEDRRKLVGRLVLVQYLVIVGFAALALAFWYFQVVQHQRFRELAENNHQRNLGLRAPRGVMFDRHGKVLVENRDSFVISIVREPTRDRGRARSRELNRALLARVLGVDESVVREAIFKYRSAPAYQPIPVVEDATLAQVAAVMAHRLDTELPEVIVERVPTRRYPESMAAHLFGYVSEATEIQLARDGYRSGDLVGQAGFERVYNKVLMGVDGAKQVVVNSMGREIRTLREMAPSEGHRVQLTIDYDVQRAAEEGFTSLGYAGAAVILEPNTGEVLAYASLPAYDPNAFASGIDRAAWASLNADPLKPLQDRAIQGRYSPGSTFKMAVAAAALEEGVITPEFSVHCRGGEYFYGRRFACWKKEGHGTVDLRHAIERSCDVYFYTLGKMLGVDRMHKWATRLGLGVKSGIDLPNEQLGLVPSSEWKRLRFKEPWYPGETISVAIGQGQVSVTPVSMAVYAAALANGGRRVTPHVLRAVEEGDEWKVAGTPAEQGDAGMKADTMRVIDEGLWMVVNGAGTGGNARMPGYDVSGKTGTVQVISLEGARALKGRTDLDLRDHGWFVFLAPRDNPQIAGAIFVEHGEHGTTGALVARHVLETFFAKKEGRPMPVFKAPPHAISTRPAFPVAAPAEAPAGVVRGAGQ